MKRDFIPMIFTKTGGKMSNRLSHSSVNMFSDCSYKFKLHYQERLRSTTQSAALLFGTAIDKAVENLVTTKNLDSAVAIFHELWTRQEINGVLTELKANPDIVYAAGDYDDELLPGQPLVEMERVVAKKKEVGFDNLELDEKKKYNMANWFIAKKRGELMLKAVNEEILPFINKVYSTQEKIDLANGNGDSVIGYVDMVAEFEGYKDPIIFDFKTSTRAYEADSVKTSPQLALYVHALENKYKTRTAGFIVLSKTIQKNRKKICSVCGNDGTGARHKTCNAETVDGERCNGAWTETIDPKCKIDVIIDQMPEQLENIVLENFDGVSQMINNGIFIRNLNSCVKPYGRCTFYNKFHNNSSEGLIEVEKKA